MRVSFKTGLSFGLTSGIITTLGLIVGLHAGTHSRIAVIGGILTIAVADAFSDALGIHVSQESQQRYSGRSIWEATIATFLAKLVFTLTFIIPVLVLELNLAILVSVIWGLVILTGFSFIVAKRHHEKAWDSAAEHFIIALVVMLITRFVGDWIALNFN